MALGWFGFSIGTALFSKKMWDDIEERQTKRQRAREAAEAEKAERLEVERERNERLRKQFRQKVRVVAVCRMNFRRMVTKPDTITDLSYHLAEQAMNSVVDKLEAEFSIGLLDDCEAPTPMFLSLRIGMTKRVVIPMYPSTVKSGSPI